MCGDFGHWAKDCSDRKDKHKKSANIIVASTDGGTSGYGNLPLVLSVCHLPDWWIDTVGDTGYGFPLITPHRQVRDTSPSRQLGS